MQLATRHSLAGNTFVVKRSLSKRSILTATLLGMVVFAIFLFFVLFARFVDRYEMHLFERDESNATKPFISTEIAQLKAQLMGLISGSINNKLHILEAGIRDGDAGRGELLVIQALRSDFKLLQSYTPETSSGPNGGGVSGFETKSRQYLDLLILQEISYLKSILYFGIAFCGITVFFTGGMWLRAMDRFRKIEAQYAIASALLEKSGR